MPYRVKEHKLTDIIGNYPFSLKYIEISEKEKGENKALYQGTKKQYLQVYTSVGILSVLFCIFQAMTCVPT